MMLGKSYTKIKSSDEKIISDCLEALIGALFLEVWRLQKNLFIVIGKII